MGIPVGYATTKELEEGLLFTDLIARQEFEQKVNDEMKNVSKAYDTFKQVQLGQEVNLDIYKHAKKELKARLKDLNKLLNQNLHAATNAGMDYKAWESRTSHSIGSQSIMTSYKVMEALMWLLVIHHMWSIIRKYKE